MSNDTPTEPELIRLNKYLAFQLGVSRREADNLIDMGRVKINDKKAVLGARIVATDVISIDDWPVTTKAVYQYVALNKPIGYVCSRRAQGENPTIYDLLPPAYRVLKPVGRLDRDSSGLILLTNDGDFAYRMTHPKFLKQKIYEISLDHDLEPLHHQMISDHGITLEDGASKLILERLSDTSRKDWRITMTEGRNRQIRRTFESLGYAVNSLHRTNFGNYSLGDIKPKEYATVDMR